MGISVFAVSARVPVEVTDVTGTWQGIAIGLRDSDCVDLFYWLVLKPETGGVKQVPNGCVRVVSSIC